VRGVLALDRRAIAHLIDMGPNAWHRNSDSLADELAALPESFSVTFSVSIGVYRPR
jgi:23S rRNA (guanine745-N1)-methyltransferase/23S rRNA (guanine748-N1)-methyltransferase